MHYAFFVLFLLFGHLAHAQSYPSHPITLVVPGAPGGAVDAMARRMAVELRRRLNQAVVIEDVPGASGTLAASKVVRAAPDGYTLMIATPNELILAPLLVGHATYNHADFSLIGKIAESPIVLVSNPALKLHNLREVVDSAKNHKDGLTVGVVGANSIQALAAKALRASGLPLIDVPYLGAPSLLQDLVSGRIDLGVLTMESALLYRKSEQIDIVAALSGDRSAISEGGGPVDKSPVYSKIGISLWTGLVGPAHIPGPVIDRLSDALRDVLRDPVFAEQSATLGNVIVEFDSPFNFERRLVDERQRYLELLGR